MGDRGSLATRICRFELDPRGFVRATCDRGAEFVVADAEEALVATRKIAGGRRRPVLVDMRWIKSQTREARERFAADDVAEVCSAVSVLVESPVSRVIGNFFLRQTVQKMPNRLDTVESDAIAWLLRHVS